MYDNSKNSIDARKAICGELCGALHVLNSMIGDGEKLEAAVAFCGITNQEGGLSETRLKQLLGWFQDTALRASMLQMFLMGYISIEFDEEGSPVLVATEAAKEKLGDINPLGSMPVELEWLGIHMGEEEG